MNNKTETSIGDYLGLPLIVSGIVLLGTYFYSNSWNLAFIFGLMALMCILLMLNVATNKVRYTSIAEIDEMTGEEFEDYLALLYEDLGYEVETTPKKSDFGADLILIKDNHKVVVQAKRYSKNVGIKAIQEVISAIKYYDSDEAWVVTNSYFTSSAIELAKSNEVTLIEREDLIKLIKNR